MNEIVVGRVYLVGERGEERVRMEAMIPAERLYFDYFATCTCPPTWHGIIPPTCPVHNPGTTWTTNTYPAYRAPYKCPTCRKRYLPPYAYVATSCTVAHSEGDCCHYGEQRVDKKGRLK